MTHQTIDALSLTASTPAIPQAFAGSGMRRRDPTTRLESELFGLSSHLRRL